MVLLDAVTSYTDGSVGTRLQLREGIAFFIPDLGVPAHVGLEYMAQTCGAYAGMESVKRGIPIRMGYLLGTRNYRCTVEWFPPNATLTAEAHEVLRQENLGVFDCSIAMNGQEVATAQLTVYQAEELVRLPVSQEGVS